MCTVNVTQDKTIYTLLRLIFFIFLSFCYILFLANERFQKTKGKRLGKYIYFKEPKLLEKLTKEKNVNFNMQNSTLAGAGAGTIEILLMQVYI